MTLGARNSGKPLILSDALDSRKSTQFEGPFVLTTFERDGHPLGQGQLLILCPVHAVLATSAIETEEMCRTFRVEELEQTTAASATGVAPAMKEGGQRTGWSPCAIRWQPDPSVQI